MRDITIVSIDLSQYHAGQMVEHRAALLRDHEGVWHAVVSTHDRSAGEWSHEVATHETRAEAEAALERAGLVISSVRSTTYSMRRIDRLQRLLVPRGYGVHLQIDPITATVTYRFGNRSRAAVALSDAEDMILADARREFRGMRVGRWEHSNTTSEFVEDESATRRWRHQLDQLA